VIERRAGEGASLPEPPDPDTARRMLRGLVAPDDAPPGYAPVATLLRMMRPPDDPASVHASDHTIRMIAAVICLTDPHPAAARMRVRGLTRRLGRRRRAT
jgi:hypothetical protein